MLAGTITDNDGIDEKEEKERERWLVLPDLPNQNNTLLIDFRPSSRCRICVNNHPLSIQIGGKRAKTCMQCVDIPTELPFCVPPLVVGFSCSTSPTEYFFFLQKRPCRFVFSRKKNYGPAAAT